MRLLKAVVAGFFVVVVGFFTAAVIALSAVAVFIGRRLKAFSSQEPAGSEQPRVRRPSRGLQPAGDVIDVTATEVRAVQER